MHGVPAILIHGGAGGRAVEIEAAQRQGALAAAERGWAVLVSGGGALDAVVAAVVALEADPVFNAGLGSVLTTEGTVEMDASVMRGADLGAGAVGTVSGVRHPVLLARAVLERTPHVLLVGDAVRRRAPEWGVELCAPEELVTPRQRERWQARVRGDGGTVGAVAVDREGHVAAATSTGGIPGRWSGRIGDSAVIGAGTYADDRLGAASATGHGEAILRVALAHAATALLAGGLEPRRAAEQAVAELGLRTGAEAGLILVDPLGRLGWAWNTESMPAAFRTPAMAAADLCAPPSAALHPVPQGDSVRRQQQ